MQLSRDFSKTGKYPDTKEESDGGKGLKVSSGTTLAYRYKSASNTYCLSATSNGLSYRISTATKTVTEGSCFMGWKELSDMTPRSMHSCGISIEGELYCWGSNVFKQLSYDSLSMKFSPDPVIVNRGAMPSGPIKQVSTGELHTCAIASDDNVYCFGYNGNGQLGNGTYTQSILPVAVSRGAMPVGPIKQITPGSSYTCALASDNKSYCWGGNAYGVFGNGSSSGTSNIPVATSNGAMTNGLIKSISAGYRHTCAVAMDDKLYCWGHNTNGELGIGNTADSFTPAAVLVVAIPTGLVKQISLGYEYTCAIGGDDKAYCWDRGYGGQLGNGESNKLIPTLVSQGAIPVGVIKYISASSSHSCVIASDDNIYCWGGNAYGQLGSGSYTNSLVSAAISKSAISSGAINKLSLGYDFSCMLIDSDMSCWGNNSSGMLAMGYYVYSKVPVSTSRGAMASGAVKSIVSGEKSLCSISSDDNLYCWGVGGEGQLADNSLVSEPAPASIYRGVIPSGAIKQISSLANHV